MTAQDQLTGTVLDGDKNPVAYASVTLHRPGSDTILAFALTENNGVFTVALPELATLEARASFLGKRPDTILLRKPIDFPLEFTLLPATEELVNVTVRAQRKPITERGDTVIYNVDSFKETDDERIQDILRKIPGITVKEGGAIEVKGKPLQRILIEGSDLFGRDYQLASRNIRAKDIATIEEIDHYQNNILLKSINDSEAIVLNLKLKDEAKGILSGSVIPGVGYGDEFKYSGYASLFNISRKNKTIFIGNADNIASGFGGNDLKATYNGSQGYDLRREVNKPFNLLNRNRFDNLGLRSEYTDNGHTLFNTLRNETNISSRWTLNVNGVYSRTTKAQRQINEQVFRIDSSSFTLREINDWSNRSNYFEPEAEFSYLSGAKKTAVDIFFKASREYFDQSERRSFEATPTTSLRSDQYDNVSAKVLLSHEVKPGLVMLIEIGTGSLTESLNTSFVNSPLVALPELELTTVDSLVLQNVRLHKEVLGFQPRFIYRLGSTILNGSVSISHQELEGVHEAEEEAFFAGEDWLVLINQYKATISLKSPIKKSASLRAEAEVAAEEYSYLENTTVYPYLMRGIYEYNRPRGGTFRLSLTRERTSPSDTEHLFGFPLVTSPRTISLPGERPALKEDTKLSLYFSRKNALRLSQLQFRLAATYTENANFSAVGFFSNAFVNRLASGRTRSSTSGSVRYEKFIAPLKSDLTLGLRTAYSRSNYLFEGRDISLSSWENMLNANLNGLITPKLRFKGGLRAGITAVPVSDNTGFEALSNHKVEVELTYIWRNVRNFVGASYVNTATPDRSNRLTAAYLGLKKEMKTKYRTITIDFRVYNLANRGNFALIDGDAAFEYRTITPAVGRFFMLTVDYGL